MKSAITDPNPQSPTQIRNHQSKSAITQSKSTIDNRKIRNPQPAIRNQ